ncbi:MAG TPA: sulfatase [Armatimonadota bacterium]|nr:sulfatase [Armatimonadota bacterium]
MSTSPGTRICRRAFVHTTGLAAAAGVLGQAARASGGERPNILWLISEDHGPELGCYGTAEARTPNLDGLASDGARYTQAFTTAPVCSAARSAFMTSMYQTAIGAHHHRSHRDDDYHLPEGVDVITKYFRDAGYFTANVKNAAPGVKGTCKTDWNFKPNSKPFDGDDWVQRADGQPFFAQVNFAEAHRMGSWQHMKDPALRVTDPDKVELPPYYPDHPVVRDDWARYLDSIALLDTKVGKVLQRLDDEGLAENTIVVFFGDHGRAMVRGKQWPYDSGLNMPLIIRWPGHVEPDAVCDDLVAAIDFGPTCMELAGIAPPEHLHGVPFLGPNAVQRDHVVGARDRCDETLDRIRTVRTRRYRYIKNFMPERPYTQPNNYKENWYPPLGVLKDLHAKGELTPAQAHFMADRKPDEELYDIQADPWETVNLANSSKHQGTLGRMRGLLDQWLEDYPDLGAIPE